MQAAYRPERLLAALLLVAGTLGCGEDSSSSQGDAGQGVSGQAGTSGTSGAGGQSGAAGQSGASGEAGSAGTGGVSAASIWINAYYAGWQQDRMPPSEIDFGAVTHITHFSLLPSAQGALDGSQNGLTPGRADAIVAATHAAGKKVLVSIGGGGTYNEFHAAITGGVRSTLVRSIVDFAKAHNYDGVDIDMEPVQDADVDNYVSFISELRKVLDAERPGSLITTAAGTHPTAFVRAQADFDQINIMTYDISGKFEGWETWHNTPLFNGGHTFKSTGGPMPSCDTIVQEWAAAGIPRAKLGIGIDFYAWIWKGANGPNQNMANTELIPNVSYDEMMSQYYTESAYRWHDGVEAPYLSIGTEGQPGSAFVSFEDEKSCTKKIEYVKKEGFGGLIIWELGGGYRKNEPAGSRDLLLQSVKKAAFP